MVQKHFIFQKSENGNGYHIERMKAWLRLHPDELPNIGDVGDFTSHQLRLALKNKGWPLIVKNDIFLIKPDINNDTSYADDFFLNNTDSSDPEEDLKNDQEDVNTSIQFSLEKDLQKALRTNIHQLEPELTIADNGQERLTKAGRIDILARDSKGQYVVIELKAGKAQSKAISQISAYMGAIMQEADENLVRGILLAGDFDENVILASKVIPNLTLKKYGFQFTFQSVINVDSSESR
jgi:hypothetical protein